MDGQRQRGVLVNAWEIGLDWRAFRARISDVALTKLPCKRVENKHWNGFRDLGIHRCAVLISQ